MGLNGSLYGLVFSMAPFLPKPSNICLMYTRAIAIFIFWKVYKSQVFGNIQILKTYNADSSANIFVVI